MKEVHEKLLQVDIGFKIKQFALNQVFPLKILIQDVLGPENKKR